MKKYPEDSNKAILLLTWPTGAHWVAARKHENSWCIIDTNINTKSVGWEKLSKGGQNESLLALSEGILKKIAKDSNITLQPDWTKWKSSDETPHIRMILDIKTKPHEVI